MVGNSTVETSQCKPETLLYSNDECNKQPCGEGKNFCFFIYTVYPFITISNTEVLTFNCFCIDQIMPVESKKPITEEDTLEEECEDEMITVTPFAIEPDYEVSLFLL
jgi:hypothetical protein